jgi:superfamily II DNA or RNA helicase
MSEPSEAALADRLPGRVQALFCPGAPSPAGGHVALWGRPAADLADAATGLGFVEGRAGTLRTVLPRTARARTRVAPADVPAWFVSVLPATTALVALPAAGDWPAWRRPSASLLAWSVAAKLAAELVAAGRIVPQLRVGGGQGLATWRCAAGGDRRLSQLAEAMPPAAHALVTEGDRAVWRPLDLVRAYLDAVADACARSARTPRRPQDTRVSGPPAAAPVSPAEGWSEALRADDPTFRVPAGSASLEAEFTEWADPLLGALDRGGARLCLRLEPPEEVTALDDGLSATAPPPEAEPEAEQGAEPGDGPAGTPWRLDYLLQAADDPSLLVPAEEVWAHAGGRLPLGDRELGDVQESLVRGLAEAARLFPPLATSLDESAPAGLELDARATGSFLTEAATLSAAGIGVLLPAELTTGGQRRLRARLRARASTAAPGGERKGGLGGDELAAFSWEAAIGDEAIDPAEFARIVALKQPLVRWRGRWVRVDPDEATTLASLVGRDEAADTAELLAAALTGEREVEGLGALEVVNDAALAEFVSRLRDGDARPPRLEGVQAELRPYQQRGVAWLQTLAELGLGGVLADDMGLGKTLQSIALLADRPGDRPHLVVCPVSVVGNWERELARFAPELPIVRHHGPQRGSAPDAFRPGAVAVTSYGVLRLDAELFAGIDWDVVVLDEAQQVKNHRTQAAKAARQLPAAVRLALTGTPVENRLAELWSILDLTTPGLLGGFERFRRDYAAPIERWQDPDATRRLRQLTTPFVLRRTKSDPTIAPELPDKTELTVTCQLTREQATLYQAAVDDTFAQDLGEGIERRGRILKLLGELKQICNHPAQFLGERGPLPGRSGKLARTVELLAEVVEAGDRALVFTQYRRMGELLASHLAAGLGLPEVPFLHGGVSRSGRERLVDAFQHDDGAPPLLLVSLKAGGTGLNLTRATHVLHFDRWWNPAVEDQATDRAYRIGQHRAVLVHKLVTAGTLEERIAAMIDDKRALADAVLGEGEAWLTELDDDALRELVDLRTSGDPEVADDDVDREEVAGDVGDGDVADGDVADGEVADDDAASVEVTSGGVTGVGAGS